MRRASLLLAATLVLAACGSGTMGALGDILGSPSSTQPSDVRGFVSEVNTGAQRIDLDVSYVNNLRQDNNQRGSIYYNSSTRVTHNGNQYNVTDLERGDEITVTGVNDNGRYVATEITVVRDATP